MKNKFLVLSGLLAAVSGASAQGLVAGWDFADVPNLVGTQVDGYAAEKTAFNNSVTTSGSISSDLTQGTEASFFAGGNLASQPGFGDGFDQTASSGFGGVSGQQMLSFTAGSAFNVVFNFTDAYDVVINADWLTSTTGGATDILDISYSSDAGGNWTTYDKANGQYGALGSSSGWFESTGDAGGFIGFTNSGAQSDMVIDLSSVTLDAANTVNAVRFEFVNLNVNEQIGLDNVHIAGTAVPEPSSFAAIFGALSMAFVALRRRK